MSYCWLQTTKPQALPWSETSTKCWLPIRQVWFRLRHHVTRHTGLLGSWSGASCHSVRKAVTEPMQARGGELKWVCLQPGFPGGASGEKSSANAGDAGSIPGSGRFPGGGNGYPLQYDCLRNTMDRGAWRAPWGRKRVKHHRAIEGTQNTRLQHTGLLWEYGVKRLSCF